MLNTCCSRCVFLLLWFPICSRTDRGLLSFLCTHILGENIRLPALKHRIELLVCHVGPRWKVRSTLRQCSGSMTFMFWEMLQEIFLKWITKVLTILLLSVSFISIVEHKVDLIIFININLLFLIYRTVMKHQKNSEKCLSQCPRGALWHH